MTMMIRPELRDAVWRWREVLGAGALAAFGLWLIVLGGFILIPLGVLAIALAFGLGLMAWRRLRFAQTGAAPGVVEIDEGQVSFFGPALGGSISLPELVELRLIVAQGRRLWRLKQADGQALLIPVEAVGAESLFDAFAALPGMQTSSLLAALDSPKSSTAALGLAVQSLPDSRVIWRRAANVVLT